MRKNEFELGEITDDVIVYVDKYIKLLMSNVKYSFLDEYSGRIEHPGRFELNTFVAYD